MKKEIMGGELFQLMDTSEYLKTGLTNGYDDDGNYTHFIVYECFEDQEMFNITDYGVHTEEEFDEKYHHRIQFIKRLTEEERNQKAATFREAISLAKKEDKDAYVILENHYKRVINILINNNGYDNDEHPLSREDIINAGLKGFKKALHEVRVDGPVETFIRRGIHREMISALKMSTRKKQTNIN